MAPLLPTGLNDGLERGGKGVPAGAVTAERRLAPKDETAELALGMVVGRLDAVASQEGPERVAKVAQTRSASMAPGRGPVPSRARDEHRDDPPRCRRSELRPCTGYLDR